MEFKYNSTGFMNIYDFNELIAACKTIGNAIFYPTTSGMTENGVDYVPVDLIEDHESIKHALEVVNSYFKYPDK